MSFGFSFTEEPQLHGHQASMPQLTMNRPPYPDLLLRSGLHFFIRHVWPKPHCTRLARRSKLVAVTRPWSKNSPTWTRDWTKRHYRWMLTSKMSTSGTSSHLLLHSSLWEAFGLQLGRPFNDCQLRMPNPTIQRFRIGFPNRFEVSFGITVSVDAEAQHFGQDLTLLAIDMSTTILL